MLSDALRLTRKELPTVAVDIEYLRRALEVFELEARNMETRLYVLTGRPHVALDGRLITAPAYQTEPAETHHA